MSQDLSDFFFVFCDLYQDAEAFRHDFCELQQRDRYLERLHVALTYIYIYIHTYLERESHENPQENERK